MNGDGVTRHHIRPVGKPGNAPKPLRLALGKVAVAAAIKTGELGVLVGLNTHPRL